MKNALHSRLSAIGFANLEVRFAGLGWVERVGWGRVGTKSLWAGKGDGGYRIVMFQKVMFLSFEKKHHMRSINISGKKQNLIICWK